MNWRQTKCIRINEIKVIAGLFDIGSNWNGRKEKLDKIDCPKAKKLYNELDRRIDRIVEAVRDGDVIASPRWYFEKIMKPFTDELRLLANERNANK